MRILEKYILISILKTFIAISLIFIFLYIFIDSASNLEDFIKYQISIQHMLQYYLSLLPIILWQTAPIACLLSCLLVLSQSNGHNEIIILRAGGLSFWRIAKPAIFFGLLVSIMIFYIGEKYVPQATVNSESLREQAESQKNKSKERKQEIRNLTFYGLNNRLFFIDLFKEQDYSLKGITILGQDQDQNIKEKIIALEGKWTGIAWKFFKCQISTFSDPTDPTSESIRFYQEKLMDIKETPRDFLRQHIDVASMNIKQLARHIRRFKNSGAARALNNMRVDLHEKIAYPFGTMVILLVGLPLALMTGRRKALTFSSLGIAVVICFAFYVMNAVGLALGKGGMLFPLLSAWLAHIIFILFAFYIIKKNF